MESACTNYSSRPGGKFRHMAKYIRCLQRQKTSHLGVKLAAWDWPRIGKQLCHRIVTLLKGEEWAHRADGLTDPSMPMYGWQLILPHTAAILWLCLLSVLHPCALATTAGQGELYSMCLSEEKGRSETREHPGWRFCGFRGRTLLITMAWLNADCPSILLSQLKLNSAETHTGCWRVSSKDIRPAQTIWKMVATEG